MRDEAPGGASRSHRSSPVRAALPVVKVRSTRDMAVMCARHYRLLRDYAHHHLPEADIEAVELVTDRAVARLLEVRRPRLDHGLDYASDVVKQECRRFQAEQDDQVVDVYLGPITPEHWRAIERLGRVWQRTLRARLSGQSPVEIARAEGVHPTVVYQRLHRARRRVFQLLQDGGHAAPALLLLPARRLRHLWLRSAGRRPVELIGESVAQPLLTALVPVMVGALLVGPAVTPAAPLTQAPRPTMAQPQTLSGRLAAATVAPHFDPTAAPTGRAVATSPPTPSHDTAVRGWLPLPPDSPDDSTIVAVAVSPHYAEDHTALALGLGRTCACPLLFRTTNGGSSWERTTIAATGTQLVLAPTFPADPRIFIGQEPGSATPDWVSPRWGSPFTPLPFPAGAAGHLAVAGSRLLSAGTAAVWSLDGTVATPVITYGSAGAATITSNVTGAYVLTPPFSVGPDGRTNLSPALFACTPACHVVGGVPLPNAGPLAVSGSVVVAASGTMVAQSLDGGHTFQVLSAATPASAITTLATTATVAWLVQEQRAAARAVGQRGQWRWLVVGDDVRAIVPLSATRLLAQLVGGGLSCSSDGGATWAPRCQG